MTPDSNSGHTLAKLIDPCIGRSVRVVAVTHPPYLVSMEALLVAEQGRALLMRGTEGEAYAAPRRQPRMLGLVDGRPQVMFEQAHQDTFEEPEQGCSVTENAELITQMLAGQVAVLQSIANQVAALSELAQDH